MTSNFQLIARVLLSLFMAINLISCSSSSSSGNDGAQMASGLSLLSRAAPGLTADSAIANSSTGRAVDDLGRKVSSDGRYLVFESKAADLVPDDTNASMDVFRYDYQTDTVELVSVSLAGKSANGRSFKPVISGDGNTVAFTSTATNMETVDTEAGVDVFARDMQVGETVLVSINHQGTGSTARRSEFPLINSDGTAIVFRTNFSLILGGVNYFPDDLVSGLNITQRSGRIMRQFYHRNLSTNTTRLVTISNDGLRDGDYSSRFATLSDDGNKIAFQSDARNLVSNPLAPEVLTSVYVRDIILAKTTLLSVKADGMTSNRGNGPRISANGNVVAYTGYSVVPTRPENYATSLDTGITNRINMSKAGLGYCTKIGAQRLSANGRRIAYEGNCFDVTELDYGASTGPNNIYVWDMDLKENVLAGMGQNGMAPSWGVSGLTMSADGNLVGFYSLNDTFENIDQDNIPLSQTGINVNPYYDAFVRDINLGVTTLVSRNYLGTDSGDQKSGNFNEDLIISDDGSTVVYTSIATDLVADTKDYSDQDIFMHKLGGNSVLVSRRARSLPASSSARGESKFDSRGSFQERSHKVSADGRYVVFDSFSPDIAANDNNNGQSGFIGGSLGSASNPDVFLADRQTGNVILISRSKDRNDSANGASWGPIINADGTVVIFTSTADDLETINRNTGEDLYAYDIKTKKISLVSINYQGIDAGNGWNDQPVISDNGNIVVWQSVATDFVEGNITYPVRRLSGALIANIFARDLAEGLTYLVSSNEAGFIAGNEESFQPVISADGKVVSYLSNSTNLVNGFSLNGFTNIFAWDIDTGKTTLVSVDKTGKIGEGGSQQTISADGSRIAFSSFSNQINDLDTDDCGDLVKQQQWGVGFCSDIFIRDLIKVETTLISLNKTGVGSGIARSSYPTISDDGNRVAYKSEANDLVENDSGFCVDPVGCIPAGEDVFIRDVLNNKTILASVTPDGSGSGNSRTGENPRISRDGNIVAYTQNNNYLVNFDLGFFGPSISEGIFMNLYAFDLRTNKNKVLTVNKDRAGGANSENKIFDMSVDGSVIVFLSSADNLVENDFNGYWDIFSVTLDAGEL